MKQWWESDAIEDADAPKRIRAIAYYRHSAQDRQENSIPIQRDQVREWAEKNGVEIIHEFSDAGKEIISPPALRNRFKRPQIEIKPSSSIDTISPVLYQILPSILTNGSGPSHPKYPPKTDVLQTSSMPDLPVATTKAESTSTTRASTEEIGFPVVPRFLAVRVRWVSTTESRSFTITSSR